MIEVPTQLFNKAAQCGFICIPSATGAHRIQSTYADADWCLVCHQEVWVLTVKGFPQIRFRYEEVLRFLERFAPNSSEQLFHITDHQSANSTLARSS